MNNNKAILQCLLLQHLRGRIDTVNVSGTTSKDPLVSPFSNIPLKSKLIHSKNGAAGQIVIAALLSWSCKNWKTRTKMIYGRYL